MRDALLERPVDRLDLDFVLAEKAVETAAAIAHHYDAGFVLLDAERQIARVVFDHATADFALQVGSSLEMDLQRRDFTVNAIAYSPHTQELHDPLRGYRDLEKRLIRMVCLDNLREDPLRLLRAYRQAAQLGFSLEPGTQVGIRQLAACLADVAAERVQSELRYLLSSAAGTAWLTTAWQDGLFAGWFAQATLQSLANIAALDWAAVSLEAICPGFSQVLHSKVRDSAFATKPEGLHQATPACNRDRNWLTTAKLVCLLPPTPDQAEAELQRLKYSRAELRAVMVVLKYLPRLLSPGAVLTLRDQYYFFQEIGPVFPTLAVLAVALGMPLAAIAPLGQRFLTLSDPVAHPVSLVTGQQLMTGLDLPPGPLIGKLLSALQLAQAEGTITTPDAALELAAQLLQAGTLGARDGKEGR